MTLSHYVCLNVITEYEKEDCYADSIENLKINMFHQSKSVNMSETCLFNSIIIYDDKNNEIVMIAAVIKFYLILWKNHRNTVDILKSNYLQVLLKADYKNELLKLLKQIYSLKDKTHCLVDDKFDKLHCQNWMKWLTQSISFSFSVFVVWKTVMQDSQSKQKNCIVINIQRLNKIL